MSTRKNPPPSPSDQYAGMEFMEKVHAGGYDPKEKFPDRSSTPPDLDAEICAAKEAVEHAQSALESAYAKRREWSKAQEAVYYQKRAVLHEQFRIDLENECGVSGHPKASALYNKAYERGHSGGLSEIANVYMELADLIK